MRKFRIKRVSRNITRIIGDELIMYPYAVFFVQMKTSIGWMTVKEFSEPDEDYAFRRAQELLDMLNENI